MTRPYVTPIIPASDHEYQVYHGNLALSQIDATTLLGERVLTSYFDSKPIGMGGEKVVYHNKDRADQVVAFYQSRGEGNEGLSADELKSKYYVVKLMHVLLPNNIPDAHFVGAEPRRMHLDAVANNPMDDETFNRLYKDLRSKTDPLGIFLDPKRSNYLLGDDGYLKYVDDFGLPEGLGLVEAEISKIEDPTDREQVQRYASKVIEFKNPRLTDAILLAGYIR